MYREELLVRPVVDESQAEVFRFLFFVVLCHKKMS